jgi:transcription antitermination protein NusB
MTAGKRRTAREMAVQMLYQSDLGGSPLPQIFNAFDLAEYLARPAGTAGRRKAAAAALPAAPPLDGAPPPELLLVPISEVAITLQPEAPRGDVAKPAGGRPPVDRAEAARQKVRIEDAFAYAQDLVRGTVDHREEIDAMIRGQADNWRLERMPPVDRNILRLAIYEMLYEHDTPKLVVVDEAIELAKKFGSEQSGRFVNGLLDGLLKQHTFPGSLT